MTLNTFLKIAGLWLLTLTVSRADWSPPPGSMLSNSVYCISNRVHGKDGMNTNLTRAVFASRYATPNEPNTTIQNPNCWLHGVKGLTAISPWNQAAPANSPGTPISPRHIVMASHNRTRPPNTFKFITTSNTAVMRKMIAQVNLTNVGDLTIGLLDADLPDSIGFLRVLPPTWPELMPTSVPEPPRPRTQANAYPIVAFNHLKMGFVSDLAGLGVQLDRSVWFPEWFDHAVGGDSGHPLCVLANNELFLISHYTTAMGGPRYSDYIPAINAAMESLSRENHAPVYRLSVADELTKYGSH